MRRFLTVAVTVAAVAAAALGAPPRANAAAAPKVVIVVGATGSTTSSYRSDADALAVTAAKYTSNVVKVYSPNATYAAVAAAAAGANILVYLGHGSGWPNPYAPYHQTGHPGDNGMGLNSAAGSGDSNTTYWGEDYMAQLGLAPNALVLLWHLCYASGDNEWGQGLPSLSTAKQRVDGYASGFIRAGASAVIADGVSDVRPLFDALFSNPTQTIDYIWKHAPNFHNHVSGWTSTHVDGSTDRYSGRGSLSQIDPDIDHPAADGDYYYRSMVGAVNTTAAQITGGGLNPNVSRWSGADRYETAASVSKNTFAAGVPVAFIALGTNFADALAGAAAGAKLGGPVLLVDTSSIPGPTATELTRLKPAKIVILGGTSVISTGVETALDQYTTGAVERWSDSDRYGTAADISSHVFPANVAVAFVAVGTNFPDALSGAAAAGKLGGPVLLVTSDTLPTQTGTELKRLNPGKIVVLGGSGVIGDDVVLALQAFTKGTVERWYGVDRFETSATISKNAFAAGVPVAFVALGTNFPDALAGGAAAGKLKGPVLLINSTDIPAPIATELTRLKPAKIVVLGGTAGISAGVTYQLGAFVPPA